MRSIALSLSLALVACGGKSKPAPTTPPPDQVVVADPKPADPPPATDGARTPKATPSDAELEKLFAASLDFFDALGSVISQNQNDCSAMAKALDQVFTQHQSLLDEARAYKGNAEVDARADAYMDAHKDRLSAATGKMGAGLQACANDPDVAEVMKRFDDM
jgi:hypothetical protein